MTLCSAGPEKLKAHMKAMHGSEAVSVSPILVEDPSGSGGAAAGPNNAQQVNSNLVNVESDIPQAAAPGLPPPASRLPASAVVAKTEPAVLEVDEDSQSSLVGPDGLSAIQAMPAMPAPLPGHPPSVGTTSSGRVSAGSSIEDPSGSVKRSGSTEGIKCALCTETFADSAALQAHTLINHTSEHLQVLLSFSVLTSGLIL